MGDDPIDVEEAREKVRHARAAYNEALAAQDPHQTKKLKDELYDPEATLVRVKRGHESVHRGTCFDFLSVRGLRHSEPH